MDGSSFHSVCSAPSVQRGCNGQLRVKRMMWVGTWEAFRSTSYLAFPPRAWTLEDDQQALSLARGIADSAATPLSNPRFGSCMTSEGTELPTVRTHPSTQVPLRIHAVKHVPSRDISRATALSLTFSLPSVAPVLQRTSSMEASQLKHTTWFLVEWFVATTREQHPVRSDAKAERHRQAAVLDVGRRGARLLNQVGSVYLGR